jgi:hypothetical protein
MSAPNTARNPRLPDEQLERAALADTYPGWERAADRRLGDLIISAVGASAHSTSEPFIEEPHEWPDQDFASCALESLSIEIRVAAAALEMNMSGSLTQVTDEDIVIMLNRLGKRAAAAAELHRRFMSARADLVRGERKPPKHEVVS